MNQSFILSVTGVLHSQTSPVSELRKMVIWEWRKIVVSLTFIRKPDPQGYRCLFRKLEKVITKFMNKIRLTDKALLQVDEHVAREREREGET
jgi:hypothetical protein